MKKAITMDFNTKDCVEFIDLRTSNKINNRFKNRYLGMLNIAAPEELERLNSTPDVTNDFFIIGQILRMDSTNVRHHKKVDKN